MTESYLQPTPIFWRQFVEVAHMPTSIYTRNQGVCRCRRGYSGRDCSLSVFSITSSAYWESEVDVDWLSGNNHVGDLPGGLFGHSLLSEGTNLWMFGGFSYKNVSSDLWRYDVTHKKWTKESPPTGSLPSPRYLHASAMLPDYNKMLLFGGMSKERETLNDFWEFNFARENINAVEGCVQRYTDASLPHVAAHTLTLYSSSIAVLIGGFSSDQKFNRQVWAYNASCNHWFHLVSSGVPFPGVYGHTSVYDNHTDKIYVYGGIHNYVSTVGKIDVTRIIYAYSLSYRKWSIMTFAKQSRTSPPPRYFHSVLPFVEGKRRGFLVLGGKRDHNTFLSDVWLFLYDCRIWIKLSADNLGSSEMSSPLVGAASAAAALSRIDSQPTSSYYVYGGSHNGVLLHTLQVFRVLSFCNAAITASDCEFLSPDCKWRPSKTSENERCVSTHSLVSDDVSWRSDAFVQNRNKSSCDSCEQMLEEDLKLVSFPRMNGACRAQECSQSMTCTECVLFLPKSNHSYCKWCTDERGTNKPFEGHCLPEDTSCPVKTDCESTICDACNELDCTACMKSTGCVWRGFSGQGICSSDYNLTSNFPKPNLINPAVPMAASKRSFSATCSKECSNYLSCDSCLKEDLPCSWSFDLALCISSTYSELLCLNGLCGQVVHSSVSECARVQCDNITYCRDCTRSPSCGWIGCEDGDGRGRCTKGTFKGPDDVNLLASYQKWYYTSCPQENECYNNHHTCSVDLHESCEDELDGFTCVCRENYVRKGRLCVPICYPACEKGVCVSPDKCRCDFGITGDLCNETCNCYGNGQCSSANLNQCEDCRNNSKGNQCEHCKVGYVGNPAKNEPCRTCLSVCNYRSDNCSSEENVYGPKSTNATICHNCLNHSEGQHCQDCIDGYYERDGSCQKCDCNNHTIYCDKQNGRCACLHNTMTVVCNANTPTSSTSPCVSGQCNMCASRFIGNPSNGGPCYEEKEEGNALCFSSLSESKCPCADCSNIHLASNQRNFFAFRPRFVDVDFRLHLDVTEGEVDIYIANSLKLFDFRIYPHHLVKRSHSNPTDEDANLLQRKIRFSSEATKEIKDNPYGDKTTRIRLIEAGNLTDYVTLDPNQPVHVRGVRNRLLLIGRHQLFNLSNTYIYVVLVAPHPQAEPVTSSGDGVKSGRSRRAVDDAQLSTRGRLVLKQNQTVLNLFVFFSSFLSCFFIFLSLGIVVWKVKQKVEMRQALIAHYMKLQQMANRPFATVNLHFDSNFDREKSRHSAFCENLLELKEIPSSRSSEPARTKSTIFIRRNRKSIAPMVSLAEPIRNNSVIEAFASSTSSPGKKSQPELSHLQSTSSELGVHDGGDGVGRQVSGQSSSVLDPQIPLLHTPSSFLTTTADGDGNPRLTPEPPPLDCPFSFTTSSPSTSLHRGTNSGFFSNSERHNPSRVAAINRTVSTPVLRNATFGALTPRSNHCPVPSGRVCRPPAASCALFKRSNSERKVCKKSDVEAVPVAFQLTRDAQAGIATVVLQLPGGKNIPCSLCLGSALVSAKHLSMVSLLDLKKSKIRSKFVTSKGL